MGRKGAVNDADKYEVIEQHQQILHKGDMYLGSFSAKKREVLLAKYKKGKYSLVKEKITTPVAIERVYLELAENACDAIRKGRAAGYFEAEPIRVTMDEECITIRNGGLVMPIKQHKSGKGYVPYVMFAVLNSSDNYDENIHTTGYKNKEFNADQVVRGRNGLGAKAAFIFSQIEEIVCADGKKQYKQKFKNNGTSIGEPKITPSEEKFVEVTYKLDFERFGVNGYTKDDFELIRSHCIYHAYTSEIDFVFNCHGGDPEFDEEIKAMNIYNLSHMVYPDNKQVLVGYLWPNGIKHKKSETENGPLEVATKKGNMPTIEFAMLDTPEQGEHLSFVNGSISRNGGTHVDAVYKAIAAEVLPEINKRKTEDGKKNRLTVAYIKKHLTVISNVNIPGEVQFDSNSKTKLEGPTFKVTLTKKLREELATFQLKALLEKELEGKLLRTFASKGKKGGGVSVYNSKLRDANFASVARKKRDDQPVWLLACEGDSAANYCSKITDHDRDHYGIFPLRGKTLNSFTNSLEKILKNKEIKALIEILGLDPGMDYTVEGALETMRYDNIVIAADQDNDGEHIKGLLGNLLDAVFPTFTSWEDRIWILQSPYMSVKVKNKRIVFFHPNEYNQWCLDYPKWANIKPKYHKGLSSSSDKEAYEDVALGNIKYISLVYDKKSKRAFRFLFDPDRVDDRKEWILQYNEDEWPKLGEKLKVSTMVKKHIIRFAVGNLRRSLPSMDGFKIGGRKVMTICFEDLKEGSFMDVEALAGGVRKTMAYHHGVAILYKTIKRMNAEFPGSNNMAPLLADGQFEDRSGYAATADRYLQTSAQPWWSYMFPEIDKTIVPRIVEDGKERELSFIPQVLPLVLINGARGVGSGWNSYIPQCKPKAIAQYYKNKLNGQDDENKSLRPWFKNFHGSINVIKTSELTKMDREEKEQAKKERRKGKDEEDEEKSNQESDDEENPDLEEMQEAMAGTNDSTYSVIISGKFEVNEDGVVTVTELPISETVNSYIGWLSRLRQEKKIATFNDHCQKGKVNIVIHGFPSPTLRNLRLREVHKLSNMNILDDDNIPRHYNTLDEIAESWYDWNLPHYEIRRKYLLKKLKEEVKVATYKAEFIRLVNKGKIVVSNKSEDDVEAQLEPYNIPYQQVKAMPIRSLTAKLAQQLMDKVAELTEQLDGLKSKRAEDLWLEDIEALEPYLY